MRYLLSEANQAAGYLTYSFISLSKRIYILFVSLNPLALICSKEAF